MNFFNRKAFIANLDHRDESFLAYDEVLMRGRKEHLELEGRRRIFDMRDRWSWCIIIWITCIVAFHIFLVVAVGRAWLTFDCGYFLPGIVLEQLIQIIAMGYIVVKFLFPRGEA